MLAFLKLVPWWVWLVLAWVLFAGVQTVRVHRLSAELITYQSAVKTYEHAASTNLDTIATLHKANETWAETYHARLSLAQSYIQANIEYQDQLQSQLVTTRKQLGAIYASHPEAKQWASQPVPSVVADQLRTASHR